jgi:hypothetical protein
VAVSDSAGVFALRYLPAGHYDLSLFQDLNRNAEPDFSELQGRAETPPLGTGLEQADTVILREVRLLRPDTTPSRLVLVEAVDSVNVRFGFDDYLDAEGSLDSVQVRIAPEEGPELPIQALLWPRERDSIQAAADSLAQEERRLAVLDSLTAVADTLRQILASMETAGDTLGVDSIGTQLERIETRLEPPETQEEEEPEPVEPPPILPQQEFFVRMADTLPSNRLLVATISGVTNINGLPDGGGEASFEWEPPEEEAADTVAAPDTAGVLPDTGNVTLPDTGNVTLPDTGGVNSPGRGPAPLPARRSLTGAFLAPRPLEPLWWLLRREP